MGEANGRPALFEEKDAPMRRVTGTGFQATRGGGVGGTGRCALNGSRSLGDHVVLAGKWRTNEVLGWKTKTNFVFEFSPRGVDFCSACLAPLTVSQTPHISPLKVRLMAWASDMVLEYWATILPQPKICTKSHCAPVARSHATSTMEIFMR
jgi:hypothetical protein